MTPPYLLVESLAAELAIPPKGILSHTLHDDEFYKVVLFAFSAGHSISPHAVPVSASLYFVEGEGTMTLGEDQRAVRPGTFIHMPPGLLHGIVAETGVKMLLTLGKKRSDNSHEPS